MSAFKQNAACQNICNIVAFPQSLKRERSLDKWDTPTPEPNYVKGEPNQGAFNVIPHVALKNVVPIG